MTDGSGYGQFCPVAKASEVVARRWTPLILRELVSGCVRFNEIHRGVPLMSRALLSRRLKELEAAGVIERHRQTESQSCEYRLTQAGEGLKPIILALGVWGQQWVESALDSPDWDAGVLMWDMRRRIDIDALPRDRSVLQFEYDDAPAELRRWWLVVDSGAVDLCQSDPGFDVDLYVVTTVRAMGQVWIGKKALSRALEDEDVVLLGDSDLRRTINRWLKLSVIAEAARQSHRPVTS